ncbi:uncharacterized protein LOC131957076 [Physella acuta]|uniref:uncharacterized protein LOC131957076 n=1 Tax=Physella acuta TaxID=109671 RepID=UPI0027DB3826|nr:uncharacterized protein LOC131957076 [Physella acuta]
MISNMPVLFMLAVCLIAGAVAGSVDDNTINSAENKANVQENLFLNILVIGDTRNDVIQTLNHKHNSVYMNIIEALTAGREEFNNKESLHVFIDLMMAVSKHEGPHTILLVATPGEPFHSQLLAQIKHFKALLGEEFIKKWCILMVPYLNLNQQENSRTEEIILEQNNGLRDLIAECSERVVYIDVKTTVKEMIQNQVDQLIQMVLIHQIQISGRRFFKDFLNKAVLERCKLDMAEIVDQLQGIDSGDFETDLENLKKLQQDSTRLLTEILKHDNETGVFRDVIKDVRLLKMQIYEHLNEIQDEFIIYLEEELAEERRITLEEKKQMLDERAELSQRRSTDKGFVGGALAVVGVAVMVVYSVAKFFLGYFFNF